MTNNNDGNIFFFEKICNTLYKNSLIFKNNILLNSAQFPQQSFYVFHHSLTSLI